MLRICDKIILIIIIIVMILTGLYNDIRKFIKFLFFFIIVLLLDY
jgi:hypothetical protein